MSSAGAGAGAVAVGLALRAARLRLGLGSSLTSTYLGRGPVASSSSWLSSLSSAALRLPFPFFVRLFLPSSSVFTFLNSSRVIFLFCGLTPPLVEYSHLDFFWKHGKHAPSPISSWQRRPTLTQFVHGGSRAKPVPTASRLSFLRTPSCGGCPAPSSSED